MNPGDTVTVTLAGVVNPAAGPYTLSVVTSSDTTPVTSPTYTIGTVPHPTIKKFAPAKGKVGAKVTIKGKNLLGAISCTIGGVTATIVTDSATKITTKVPAGAKTGKVSVTTPGGTATSAKVFTVL